MSLLSTENHTPIQLGNVAFANLAASDLVSVATIILAFGYFVIYLIDKKKEWNRHASSNGKEIKSGSKEEGLEG